MLYHLWMLQVGVLSQEMTRVWAMWTPQPRHVWGIAVRDGGLTWIWTSISASCWAH